MVRTGYRVAKFTFINALLILISIGCVAQAQSFIEVKYPQPKRFIDEIEVFAGSGLSFNHGNKFIENYSDENLTNYRLTKLNYVFGIGASHSFTDRIDVNVRVQFEQKGRKTELNTPSNPQDNRRIGFKNYNYNYLTLLIAPRVSIGVKKRFFISSGAYVSKILDAKGYEKITDSQGQVYFEETFEGRFFEDVDANGGVNSITWIPGLQSFKSSDVGVTFSMGYSFSIGERKLIGVQLIDNYGLTNINKDNPYYQQEKNHTIQLLISLSLKSNSSN